MWMTGDRMMENVVRNLLTKKEHTMPLQIEYGLDNLCLLRISGVLKQSEFAASKKDLAQKIDTGSKPRVLAIVEGFEGWETRRGLERS
jgi:hypothetical protein